MLLFVSESVSKLVSVAQKKKHSQYDVVQEAVLLIWDYLTVVKNSENHMKKLIKKWTIVPKEKTN